MLDKEKYDFSGWVTKNDILCADGVTIKQDAFKDSDGKKVPLVWNHNYDKPNNILGHIILHHKPPQGTYGYGYFNQTDEGRNAKELTVNGDISSLSIGARKIKRQGSNVIHGSIYEVSLVLAGANPGAMIDSVIQHSEDGDSESGIIYTDTLIHSADDIIEPEKEEIIEHAEGEEEKKMNEDEKTVGSIIDTLNEEQKDAVYALIGSVVEAYEDEEGDDEVVKQNVFSKEDTANEANDILRHSATEALTEAMNGGASSFKKVLKAKMAGDEVIKHGINSIEMLFPESYHSTNGNEPIVYHDPNSAYVKILASVHKSPFSKIRTLVADLTEEEARAKGYIKGAIKKEEFFSLIKRTTDPTTVYKKQKIDRDDVVDITDFNVVSFMNREMDVMLKEEIARALMVGDGRDVADGDKINEQKIRPIITDHDFFTIQKTYTAASDFVEKVILAMAEYRGTGTPSMYIDPTLLAQVKLLKGTDNRYLFGNIPSTAAVAAMLGVSDIVPTTFMEGKGALIVNLSDYSLGATKGGEVTNFDDFDIDFNQYKYLKETRLSGALTKPKSAIHMATTVVVGADAAKANLVYGERQADKPEEE